MADAPVSAPVVPEVTERKSKRSTGAAVGKVPKEKKVTAAKKPKAKGTSHPSFLEMISDAISTLKERAGSSQYAINKFVEDKHKQLPSHFRKLLLFHLKKLVASGKLVKVKNSFKLPSARVAPAPVVAKKPTASKLKVAAKPKPKSAKVVAKPKAKVSAKSKLATNTAAKKIPKVKTVAKQAKVAKTAAVASPGKKKAVKKVVSIKKAKSVKSPAGKRTRK